MLRSSEEFVGQWAAFGLDAVLHRNKLTAPAELNRPRMGGPQRCLPNLRTWAVNEKHEAGVVITVGS